MATYADKRAERSRYDRVLDLVADDLTIPEICQAENLRPQEVRILIERAMTRGDDRVRRAVGCEQKDLTDFTFDREPCRVVTQDEMAARRSLRPLIESVRTAQEDVGARSVTALICGDPPPHRSALGRECTPDEYASKGEGRWRDPCLGVAGGGMRFMNYGDG